MAARGLSVCFAIFRSIPVVFITAVIVWSYYAYVAQLCIFTMESVVEKVFCLTLYHPLLIMMMWSYWKAIFTPIALPPSEFFLSATDIERLESADTLNKKEILVQIGRNLAVQCRTPSGDMRYCEKCKAIKPDRAHHCSVCSKCILKMDHHCPWVNNCICFSNYKFFILFLGYALLYSLYVAFTSIKYFISFWSGIGLSDTNMNNLHIVFLFFAGIMFAISLLSLFGYHCFLVSKNRSTLESFQSPVFLSGPDKNGFNLGTYANFVEIFGKEKLFWFLPFFTSLGDGLSYRTRLASLTNSYHTMENAAISISQSVPSNQVDGLAYSVNVAVDDDCNTLLNEDGFDNDVLTIHKS